MTPAPLPDPVAKAADAVLAAQQTENNTLVQSLLERLAILTGARLPSQGTRVISLGLPSFLGTYLFREAERINKLNRLTNGSACTASSLVVDVLRSERCRLSDPMLYPGLAKAVSGLRQRYGRYDMGPRVSLDDYKSLADLAELVKVGKNQKPISIKALSEALIFFWATVLNRENPLELPQGWRGSPDADGSGTE